MTFEVAFTTIWIVQKVFIKIYPKLFKISNIFLADIGCNSQFLSQQY